MKRKADILTFFFTVTFLLFFCADIIAQTENNGVVHRRSGRSSEQQRQGKVSGRMQNFYESKPTHDADLQYVREIYRELDLSKPENAPLYFPEDIIDGQENLFRVMLGHVINGDIPAYEYLDGREMFTEQYKIKPSEMLDRFGIYYTKGKGSSDKNAKIVIEEADVPTNQVLCYYVLEKWEFDNRTNRMKTKVEAICPVLNRTSDFGGDARYPMFWVKYDVLRPYLAQQYIFINDDNNLPQYSIDDYFTLGMYKGEIYKTKNLRNLSLAQMYPDPDDLKQAQDSIDNRLHNYDTNLWVPTREEYLAQKEKADQERSKIENAKNKIPERNSNIAEEDNEVNDDDNIDVLKDEKKVSVRNKRGSKGKSQNKRTKVKKPKSQSNNNSNNAAKSVRRRKK